MLLLTLNLNTAFVNFFKRADEVIFDSRSLSAVRFRTHPVQSTKVCLNAAKSHYVFVDAKDLSGKTCCNLCLAAHDVGLSYN